MFGKKNKKKTSLSNKVTDMSYNILYPQDKYKNHSNIGRIFKHSYKFKDIIIVAYKDDKNWWYSYIKFKSVNSTTIYKGEYKNDKKLSWYEKKGLELEEPRRFGR